MSSVSNEIKPWIIPSAWSADGRPNTNSILKWFNDTLGTGMAFLQSQSSFADIDDAINVLRGSNQQSRPLPLSNIRFNKLKQFIREEIGILSNIRPMTDFKSDSTDPSYQATAMQLNNCYKAWYLDEHVDDKIDESLQWAALSKGFIELVWEPADDFDADGIGSIKPYVWGPRDVIPIQLPQDHDIQKAQAVIIRKEMPLDMVRARWPEFADRIQPDRSVPTSSSLASSLWQRVRSWATMFGPGSRTEDEPTPFPQVDVFYVYLRDGSLNRTTQTVDMATDKVWGYKVPPLVNPDGSPYQVWTGLYQMQNGQAVIDEQGEPKKLMRPVSRKECMLYPNRRLWICTRDLLFYDGPSYWWHGKVPLTPIDLDKWVFQYLGFSLFRDGIGINSSVENLLRNIDDSHNCRLRPPLVADTNTVPQSFLDDSEVDTRMPGKIVPLPTGMSAEMPLKPMLPAENYTIPPQMGEHIKWLVEQERELLLLPGVRDLVKAKQVPAGDSIEKLAELSGPGITKLSRRLERSLHDLGEQFKWLVFEFYTTGKRYEVLGPDGQSLIDFDYDPGNMIPDMLEEHPELAGPENRYRRARLHAKKFHFRITPNSVHNMTQYTRKMLHLMLMKQGFPMDPWTIAEQFDLVNFGPPPPNTKTIMDRWMQWQDVQIKLKGFLAQEMEEVGLGGDGGGGQGKGGGRPSSFQKAPHLAQKDGQSRSTIATS